MRQHESDSFDACRVQACKYGLHQDLLNYCSDLCVPLGGVLLEGVDDLSILAQLTDEALLSTQTAAENVGTSKLDHLRQKRSQFPINHLEDMKNREHNMINSRLNKLTFYLCDDNRGSLD